MRAELEGEQPVRLQITNEKETEIAKERAEVNQMRSEWEKEKEMRQKINQETEALQSELTQDRVKMEEIRTELAAERDINVNIKKEIQKAEQIIAKLHTSRAEEPAKVKLDMQAEIDNLVLQYKQAMASKLDTDKALEEKNLTIKRLKNEKQELKEALEVKQREFEELVTRWETSNQEREDVDKARVYTIQRMEEGMIALTDAVTKRTETKQNLEQSLQHLRPMEKEMENYKEMKSFLERKILILNEERTLLEEKLGQQNQDMQALEQNRIQGEKILKERIKKLEKKCCELQILLDKEIRDKELQLEAWEKMHQFYWKTIEGTIESRREHNNHQDEVGGSALTRAASLDSVPGPSTRGRPTLKTSSHLMHGPGGALHMIVERFVQRQQK